MNTITPHITGERTKIKSLSGYASKGAKMRSDVSFGGVPQTAAKEVTSLISAGDRELMNVFSQHYGNIGDRVGQKLAKLVNTSEVLEKSSRFSLEKGALSIKEKSIGKAVLENAVFPFINLPLNAVSWVLKKTQKVPALEKGATEIYKSPVLRIPRKLNELDSKTDILKGMYEKTKITVETFAKEKGIKPEELLKQLNDKTKKDTPLVKEANEYIKESLYKVGNKFFDKNTGNFNTAYERPLNRIVSGLIPVAFLANDAYNLSVLCGDKKEESKKEADTRTKQEIIRVFTTAYIQLMTFGAFTKQVNTIPWFAPVTSAATVLFSEIFSRKKNNRPILFLSKEGAKKINRENEMKDVAFKKGKKPATTQKTAAYSEKEMFKAIAENKAVTAHTPAIFNEFKSVSGQPAFKSAQTEKTEQKPAQPKKALMNFQTFKKGVGILTAAGFALSLIKNGSLTKNSAPLKAIRKAGKYVQDKIYKPLAFKDFEMPVKKFDKIMSTLEKSGCKEVAEGHRFVAGKYAEVKDGIVKIYQTKLPDGKTNEIISSGIQVLTDSGRKLSKDETDKLSKAVTTAIKSKSTEIAENKFGAVTSKILELADAYKVNMSIEEASLFRDAIEESIKNHSKKSAVQVERKCKPAVDMVIQPFKFVLSAAKLPFKITSTALKLAVSPVEKKAAAAALGKAELSNTEKAIHKAVTEIFGENKAKSGKISQTVFANAMESFEKRTRPYMTAEKALKAAKQSGNPEMIQKAQNAFEQAKKDLMIYVNNSVEKSFNGVTQSSNKNTDLAVMSKLASSLVTTGFLVADNYNMVMLKSDGEDKEGAKEKANERIVQRLSALFYQTLFINWFNSTFKSLYNSSLAGMTAVVIPNTLTTEVVTRKSIGMPIGRMTREELDALDEKNENRKGFVGKYFEFMRLLTGKKPLKDRLPKDKQKNTNLIPATSANSSQSKTNLLEQFIK